LELVVSNSTLEGFLMLRWALLFLVVALIAGLFGFGLVEGAAFLAAKILFFVFLILFVVSLIAGAGSRSPRDVI
jgi:uncharacterized membrane protein YtjA (UPF0391 family)